MVPESDSVSTTLSSHSCFTNKIERQFLEVDRLNETDIVGDSTIIILTDVIFS